MAINIKISKRYSIDKLKFRLKIDNKFHIKIKCINFKINNILNNNISFILFLYFFLVLFFPCLSKEINLQIFSNEITIKIKGIGDQTILDGRIENPSELYLNNESQSDFILSII